MQSAVNYATTMTVDGQNRDLVNYWQRQTICAGDRLIFRLVLANTKRDLSPLEANAPKTREFQLTSYHERPVSAPVTTALSYWQLQAHILHADAELPALEFDYRLTGYWHIAQSFQGRRECDVRGAQGRGAPLQVTFAPMFVRTGDGGAAATEALCEEALGQLDAQYEGFLASRDELRTLHRAFDPVGFQTLLRQCGVQLRTLRRLFVDGDVPWCAGELAPKYLVRFVVYHHYAGLENARGLQRRIARAMVAFDAEVEAFAGLTLVQVALKVRAFFDTVLGATKIDEWTNAGHLRPALIPLGAVGAPNPLAVHFMFADAGAAFGALGALGADLGAAAGPDLGSAAGADLGADLGASAGAEAPRPAKKKKNAALMEAAVE